MESSSTWYHLYRFLSKRGYHVILSNPVKTKAIASAAKIKTDKIDAKVLADFTWRVHWSDTYMMATP